METVEAGSARGAPAHVYLASQSLEAALRFACFFNRWFALDTRYEHTTRLYFAMRYQRDGYGDLRLLVYAQALEMLDSTPARNEVDPKSAVCERS